MQQSNDEIVPFTPGFDLSPEDVDAISHVNGCLARLAARRLQYVGVVGPLKKSKLSWKLATYQQPILYRIVMLANGCCLNWNMDNILCCVLAVRALSETTAVFLEFEHDLTIMVDKCNLTEIDLLIKNRTFATRDKTFGFSREGVQAVNVLTLIDKMDKRLILGIRDHYNFLSEICHPNSFGHHQMFGSLDKSKGTYTYSKVGRKYELFNHILCVLALLGLVEGAMNRVDDAIIAISNLEDVNDPFNWNNPSG